MGSTGQPYLSLPQGLQVGYGADEDRLNHDPALQTCMKYVGRGGQWAGHEGLSIRPPLRTSPLRHQHLGRGGQRQSEACHLATGPTGPQQKKPLLQWRKLLSL